MMPTIRDPQSPEFSPSVDHLSNLPVELKNQIIYTLQTQDRLRLRLTSRGFAKVCAEAMFQDGIFNVRPHVDDMTRLEAISEHPLISRGIRHLRIFVGDVHLSRLLDGIREGVMMKDRKRVLAMIKRMYGWPLIVRHCRNSLLNSILPRLPNLTAITATSDYPFGGFKPELTQAWEGMAGTLNSHQDAILSVHRYNSILLAIPNTKLPIQRLELDPLPFEYFAHDPSLRYGGNRKEEECNGDGIAGPSRLEKLHHVVEKVQDFRIRFVGFKFQKNLELAQSVGKFLGSMPLLRNLDLTWDGKIAQSSAFRTRWRARISKNTWPHLESLRLRYTEIPDTQLLVFLLNHSSTLRYLHLSDDAVNITKRRTPKDLLTTFRDQLNLKKFQFLFDVDDNPIYDAIYDADWNPRFQSTHSAPKDAKLFENYVLGKCRWPMRGSWPNDYTCRWERLSTDEMELEASNSDPDRSLGDDWENDSNNSGSSTGLAEEGPSQLVSEDDW